MNDEFLSHYRKAPRPEFDRSLYAHLNQQDTQAHKNFSRTLAFQRVTILLATFCLLIVATMAFSPSARAAVLNLIKTIGGLTYIDQPQLDLTPAPASPGITRYSIESAQALMPFSIQAQIPSWAPPGYKFIDRVALVGTADSTIDGVILSWSGNTEEQSLWLMVRKVKPQDREGTQDDPIVVGTMGAFTEVQINGLPGSIVHGFWDREGQWNSHGWQLHWLKDDFFYHLTTSDPNITQEQFLRMAESIP